MERILTVSDRPSTQKKTRDKKKQGVMNFGVVLNRIKADESLLDEG